MISFDLGGRISRGALGVLCLVALMLGTGAVPARAANSDPLFVFRASETAAPAEHIPAPPEFSDPCGIAVDPSTSQLYVSDYYNGLIDVFRPTEPPVNIVDLSHQDPIDGPCGLGLGSAGKLYVNDFHRNVTLLTPSAFPPEKETTFLSGPVFDSATPTGVAVDPATNRVYVDDRTYVAAYESDGTPVLDGEGQPVRIGFGTLGDGYGLALSAFPGTSGSIYVPDAADNTVKVYDPAVSTTTPVTTIAGPGGGFVSLRDAAVAVDRATGVIYVLDDEQPQFTEKPEAAIDVFDSAGTYLGHLKYRVVDGAPSGLAVDNSTNPTQGRVYVTSGNTENSSIYAYPPGSQVTEAFPAFSTLRVATGGTGSGAVHVDLDGIECRSSCSTPVHSGSEVALVAQPDPGSVFDGWSGGGCQASDTCLVTVADATSVVADFAAVPSEGGSDPVASGAGEVGAPAASKHHAAPNRHKKHRKRGRHHRRRHHHPHKRRTR